MADKTAERAAAEEGDRDMAGWLAALAPRDALEAMLAEQMAAVHGAATRALKRAAECTGHPEIEAMYLRQAARLMHLFVRQTETLERRRVGTEERADRKERVARVQESLRRQDEELRRTRERRAALWDLEPARPRRRRTGACGKGNGAADARIDLPDGLYIPDPLSG